MLNVYKINILERFTKVESGMKWKFVRCGDFGLKVEYRTEQFFLSFCRRQGQSICVAIQNCHVALQIKNPLLLRAGFKPKLYRITSTYLPLTKSNNLSV